MTAERDTMRCAPPKEVPPHQELRQELERLREAVRRLSSVIERQDKLLREYDLEVEHEKELEETEEWLRQSFHYL